MSRRVIGPSVFLDTLREERIKRQNLKKIRARVEMKGIMPLRDLVGAGTSDADFRRTVVGLEDMGLEVVVQQAQGVRARSGVS
jgi:hypothetical protein